MDANYFQEKDEEARRRALYPDVKIFESTLEHEIKGANELYYNFLKEQKAATAANAQQQQKGDTKPEGLKETRSPPFYNLYI
jgi:hypothetical protein